MYEIKEQVRNDEKRICPAQKKLDRFYELYNKGLFRSAVNTLSEEYKVSAPTVLTKEELKKTIEIEKDVGRRRGFEEVLDFLKTFRTAYSPKLETIFLTEKSTPTSLLHEFGHHLVKHNVIKVQEKPEEIPHSFREEKAVNEWEGCCINKLFEENEKEQT